MTTPPMVDDAVLHLEVTATAINVGRARRALRRWLDHALHDQDAVEDLVLAASEALENAVDHAFADQIEPGTITLRARRDRSHGDRSCRGSNRGVVITVSDDGHWQARRAPGYRGRGLALIDELVETHRLRTGRGGTTVTLRHH